MTTSPTIDLRRLTSADEPAVLTLLRTTLAGGPTGNRTPEFFEWKHRLNPFGSSPGLVATEGDTIVGVRLFLRWQLRVGNRVLPAVRAVDTATHPDYQRRGIFTSLTLRMLEDLARERSAALVFNTPNSDSRPGYLRMGWEEVATLPVRISPVRPVRFLRGARAASSANASGSASAVAPVARVATQKPVDSTLPLAARVLSRDDEVRELLDGRATPDGLHTPLSVEYLRWRYALAPGLDYRAVVLRRRGTLAGLGLGRLRWRAGLTEFTLGDVLFAAGDLGAARGVLRAARRSGADHVSVHTAPGSELDRVALGCGYLSAPRAGIGLVARALPGCPDEAMDPAGWHLTLGDLEVF